MFIYKIIIFADMWKILIVFGTRPELIKLAPIIQKLKDLKDWNTIVVASGQHKELIEPILPLFDIQIHYNLSCSNIDLIENSTCISKSLVEILRKERPNLILVQGDTLTTYVASFVAFLEKIPIVHLEAGLRSRNKFSPFPEEIYRILTDDLSDVFLAPTEKAYENLILEGKREDRIFLIGNTVVDALNMVLQRLDQDKLYSTLGLKLKIDSSILKSEPKVLITSHRRENIGEPLKKICRAVKALALKYPEIIFIWSLHKNPMVRQIVINELREHPKNLILTEALSYPETVLLLRDSILVMTDSGGIQEEVPSFRKAVLVLRNVTERSETIEYGFGFLVGQEEEKIINTFKYVYENKEFQNRLDSIPNPYGDGLSSERFVALLKCDKFLSFLAEYPNSDREVLDECKSLVGQFNYRYSYS